MRSSLGRWLSRDPLPHAFPPYAYAGNDPAYSVDPTGLVVLIPFLDINLLEELQCTHKEMKELRAGWEGQKDLSGYWKHCVAGCRTTQKCGLLGTFAAAVAKELWDSIGPGDFDLGDARAHGYGAGIGQNCPTADCEEECAKKYPKHKKKPKAEKGKRARQAP